MATIEPRLIHLLNDSDSNTPELSNTDLPPLHSLPFPDSPDFSDRPLPPFEPETGHVYSGQRNVPSTSNRPFPSDGPFQHRIDSDANESLLSLAKILDDEPDGSTDDALKKKRHRVLATRDDYLQLPQPVKKQKPSMQASAVPPIINGLHQPPPDAKWFPSMSEHMSEAKDFRDVYSAHDVEPDRLGERSPKTDSPEADKNSGKGRKRAAKPRRKWSEEETNHLLLGVNKHGVGKWTTILEDDEFKFNERSAGDLKDRFRTCCPDELRGSKGSDHATSPTRSHHPKPKKGLHSENILHEDEGGSSPGMITPPTEPDSSQPTQKKTRAHRKKVEDLENLGIHGPFKKSRRRERRPFTEQDDREILEGLEKYGPAWTKIQRDSTYHLSSRQPTDLRDRVRNKYSDMYKRIEKGAYQNKDSGRSNDIMEPTVTTSINNSVNLSNHINRTGSREDLPRGLMQQSDKADRNPSSQSSDLGDAGISHWPSAEMGIGRLLLDDPK